jgi:membrane-associated phospholipid phosphatase
MKRQYLDPMLVRLIGLVTFTAVAAAVAAFVCGIRVDGLMQPMAVVAGLALLAWLRPAFRLCMSSLAVLVAFSTAFSTLIYALGTSPWPLADDGLAKLDLLFGIDAHRIALETAARPLFAKAMYLIYFSAIPQTIVVLVWLGFRNDKRLSEFLYRFMICGLVTAACFYFAPALGTTRSYPAAWNMAPMHDILALRSGELTIVDWRSVEGIVTFPSFHTVWAVLLMLALPTWPVIALNVLMIVSTVTSGGHYAIDIVGGLLICAIVVPISDRQLAALRLEYDCQQSTALN